ncbi:MAG TPA: exodeoxyribonuclease VII small subunit [bacterium]
MPDLTFESALQRLEEIVHELEQGRLPLEESLKIHEEGMELIKFCGAKLEETEKKVKLLVKNGDNFDLKPFDIS